MRARDAIDYAGLGADKDRESAEFYTLVLTTTLGMFLMPFTVRHLGTAEYGLWMLVASMTSYFTLLDLGYGNGLVRHVADAERGGAEPFWAAEDGAARGRLQVEELRFAG